MAIGVSSFNDHDDMEDSDKRFVSATPSELEELRAEVEKIREINYDLAALLHESRSIILEWLGKQGHNRCHYYPELFEKLVKLYGLERQIPDNFYDLPNEKEFEEGCTMFRKELFHGTAKPNS